MRPVPPAALALVLSAFCIVPDAAAQRTDVELEPFAGVLLGGRIAPPPGPDASGAGGQRLRDGAYGGVRAAFFPAAAFGVELELSRASGAVAVEGAGDYDATLDYLLALALVRGSGRVWPYAGLGGGVCRLATLFGRAGGERARDRATAGAALGVAFALSERVGVRLDARAYATDIGGLDLGPPCTTFEPTPAGDNVRPVPCRQNRWLTNPALSAGIVFKL